MRLSLRVKLISAFLLIDLMVGGAAFYSIQGIQQADEQLREVIDSDLARIQILEEMQLIAASVQRDAWALSHGVTPLDLHDQNVANFLTSEKQKINKLRTDYTNHIKDETVSETQELFKRVNTETDTIFQLAAELSSQQATTTALEDQLETTSEELTVSMSTLLDTEQENIVEKYNEANARTAQLTFLATVATGGALLVSILLGVVVASSISRRMQRIRKGADNIAAGNLSETVQVTTRDELGSLAHSFNNMAESLRDSYGRLALEKERDETLLESMSEGMVALDKEGQIMLINGIASTLLELPVGQAIGTQFTTVVALHDESDQPIAPQQMPTTLTLQNGQQISGVYTRHTSDQQKLLISIAASPIKLDNAIGGAIVVMRDVTKEKEVDRMKTEFISLASHQLRTPLSAIKWYSEMLLDGDAGKLTLEQMEFASNIFDSTDRMVELVNSLLNISRIESGRIIVDPKPTDLRELIGSIVADLKVKVEQKQQVLAISVHPDLPKINLDARLVSQVYLNLLTNAIKYTPKKGEIAVFVSKKGNDVVSQVTDNGYGIPKAQQERIFQKFFRAENVAKIETDGTGLGLYLIKAIVESSGGKIWFESEEGKGTSFWFTLPLSGMKPKAGEVTLDS